jgi:uncharacterized protein YjeT (DUF2065 family)
MAASIGVTNTIAALYGLYLVAAGIGLARDPGLANRIMRVLLDEPAISYLTGILALALGGTIVAVHNQWTGVVPVIVSLLGWAVLLEGVLMLAMPGAFIRFFARLNFTDAFVRAASLAAILCGAILLYVALA